MPELPEVETVRTGLEQLVLGKTIAKVTVLWSRIIEAPEVEIFKKDLVGESINDIQRRGKFLIFQLDHWELISHLRMEGKYEFFTSKSRPNKHTHVIFHFTDGSELFYQDVRKFGRMVLVEKGKALQYKSLAKLGPEPTPETFLLKDFQSALAKHHKAIKPLLLEQKIVVGLGNIYVDEALFLAKIHPLQMANELSKRQVAELRLAIIKVLKKAVAAGGTTIRSYQNALGEAGKFQVELLVYGQTGMPCVNCGTPIEKIKVAQRGTHLCPRCQKITRPRKKG